MRRGAGCQSKPLFWVHFSAVPLDMRPRAGYLQALRGRSRAGVRRPGSNRVSPPDQAFLSDHTGDLANHHQLVGLSIGHRLRPGMCRPALVCGPTA